MKFGILSDTHNNLTSIKHAFNIFEKENVSTVLHCGDWSNIDSIHIISKEAEKLNLKVFGVFGNNDKDMDEMYEFNLYLGWSLNLTKHDFLELDFEGFKVAICHGHRKSILKELIDSQNYHAIFLGHTHKPKVELKDKTQIINPGSTSFSIPRKQKGEGISVCIYESQDRSSKFINVITGKTINLV